MSAQVLGNIYQRWKLNLDLIIKDEGDNKLVEKCRNKGDKVEDLVHIDEHKMNSTVVIEDSTGDENMSEGETSNGYNSNV